MKVRLTLTEGLLGSASANPVLVREFIASKGPHVEKEVEAIPDVDEEIQKATTVFPRTPDGLPFIYDYQIKGFFKDACSMLRRADDTLSKKLKAHKKVIDGVVFVFPRKILLNLPSELGVCERPLRAQTAQGERIALARSEEAPEGTVIEFEINMLNKSLAKLVREWLDYGVFRGLGQWRNSGKGRFEYEVLTTE